MNNFLEMVRGGDPDRVPFWFMRQAGRYLPEYQEIRAQSDGFLDMAYTPEKACEITMQPLRRFGMDAAIIFSDILVIPHALGRDLEFVEGVGPKLNPIEYWGHIDDLKYKIGKIEETLNPVYEAISLTRSEMDQWGFREKSIIGFCGGPWTLALYMLEGGGSKDNFMKARRFAYRDPVWFGKLINYLIEACTEHLIKQIEAGADAVQIFDSWAGLASAHNFEKWVIGSTHRIVKAIHEVYPKFPIIGFPNYAGQHYQDYVRKTGVTGVSIDHTVDPEIAARTLQPLALVQGNLDPACLLAGGNEMVLNVQNIFDSLKGKAGGFVFNLGHGIHKDTPIERIDYLVKIIKERGWYEENMKERW